MQELVPLQKSQLVGMPALHAYETSLDCSTDAGRLMAYKAATSRDLSLDELQGQVVDVQDYYSHWVPDTGEGKQPGSWRRRIVLIGSDGVLVSTSSEVAWRCVCAAAAIWEVAPPWNPPLRFKVHHRPRADKKGHYIYLELVI